MSDLRFSYLVLRCVDLERSAAWYRALGGAIVAEQHEGGPPHYSISLNDLVLELYPAGAKSTSDLRFGLEVRDPREAATAALALGGQQVTSAARGVVVKDPDGHTIELVERE